MLVVVVVLVLSTSTNTRCFLDLRFSRLGLSRQSLGPVPYPLFFVLDYVGYVPKFLERRELKSTRPLASFAWWRNKHNGGEAGVEGGEQRGAITWGRLSPRSTDDPS